MAIINNMPSGSSGKKYASGKNLSLSSLKIVTINGTDYHCVSGSKIGFKPSVFRILGQVRNTGSVSNRYLRTVIGNYYTSTSETTIMYAQTDDYFAYPTAVTSSPYRDSTLNNYQGSDLPFIQYNADNTEITIIKWEAWE